MAMPSSCHSPVLSWSINDVKRWLTELGLAKYAKQLCDQHRIDGAALLMLQEEDLKQPPLSFNILGDIKHLVYHLNNLKFDSQNYDKRAQYCLSNPSFPPSPPYSLDSSTLTRNRSNSCESTSSDNSSFGLASPVRKNLHDQTGAWKDVVCSSCQSQILPKSNLAKVLNPERWKTVIAFIYALSVSWLTAVTMTVVHDRVPDMNKYPPLPDIILDNIPHIPWAFEMAEMTGMILLFIWALVILFHKHRFIIARRFFSLAGTIFLLRCVTMLITSLSVPGAHLDCKPRPYATWANRLYNAYIIWSGAGLSMKGVRTCGDYMFSGHTVSLTLLNFFITEYTSRKIYFLHTFTWVLSCFGVFFILAAHEHYSIDVFVAFYITSRLFLYYHTLVNNRAVTKYQESFDAKRTWFYFPLFSFFEQNIDGRIPNEFQPPVCVDDLKTVYRWIENLYQSEDRPATDRMEATKKIGKKKRK